MLHVSRRSWLKGVAVVGFGATASVTNSVAQSSEQNSVRTLPIVEAHRGNARYAPENTLIAFQQAIEMGVDRVELDLMFTRDHKTAVIHDGTVNRTTDGTGRVQDLTLAEIRTLDAGSWKDEAYKGEKVPTFLEVLELCKGKVLIDIDLKDINAAETMVDELKQADMLQDVIVTGLGQKEMEILNEIEPALSIYFERDGELFDLFKAKKLKEYYQEAVKITLQHQGVGIDFGDSTITPELIREMHLRGLSVLAWTVDNPKRMEELIGWGVDAIMSNDPKTLLEISQRQSFIRGA